MNAHDKRYLKERAGLLEQIAWNIEHGIKDTVKGVAAADSLRHMAGEMRSYGRA
jgi:hypothetical protein